MILNKKEFTQQKYNELVSYANLNNCIIEDKGEYYETVEIKIAEPTLEELKVKKIQELKNNCQKYIYSKYPIYKQINVANGLTTEEEINLMHSFINETRLLCKEIEQKINSAKTQKKLEEISTNFNQE